MIAVPAWADCPEVRIATVPLLSDLRPVVNASIDGHPVEMLVDTGDQETAVTPQTAAELHLPRDPGQRMLVHTLGGIVGSANVIVRRLKVGSINFPDLSATVVPAPPMTNGTVPGGIIGADVLSQYDLDLNISHQTLTFYQTDGCTPFSPPWHGQYQIVPAQVGDRRFIIPAMLNGHTVQAQFDTGSRGETVFRSTANRLGITNADLDADPSNTATSAGRYRYTVRRHLFKSFGVGQEVLHNVFLDVAGFKAPGVDMLIGADYMRMGRFFLSYASGILFIQEKPAIPRPAAFPLGALQRMNLCRASPEIKRVLAPGQPVLVSRPQGELPERVRVDHISGCAGVMFHIAPDGMPVTIKVIKVYPRGYGLRTWAIQFLSQVRFEPSIVGSAWYYQAIRFHTQ